MTVDAGLGRADTRCMAAVGRIRWSWLYLWILLWMASLTIPTFRAWQRALAEHRGEGLDPNSGDSAPWSGGVWGDGAAS